MQAFSDNLNLRSTLQHSDLLYPSSILPYTAVNKPDTTVGALHNSEGASYFPYSKPAPPQTWDDADNLSIGFIVHHMHHIFKGPEQEHIVIYRGLVKLPFHA